MTISRSSIFIALAATGALTGTVVVFAQTPHSPAHPSPPAPTAPDGHAAHGTPTNWKFSWPVGSASRGRGVFVKLECYSCHEVKSERFRAPSDSGKVGPELSQMGPVHDLDYFAEAVINPSAVIDKGKGYAGADGSSKMPSFNDSITVQEAVDLVAYLKSLEPPAGAAGHSSGGSGGH